MLITGWKIACAAAAALILDALLGDPLWMPHPVVLMGRAIHWMENRLLECASGSGAEKAKEKFLYGLLMTSIMVTGTLFLSGAALFLVSLMHPALFWLLEVFWGWQCLAMKGLAREGENVRRKLTGRPLEQARSAVGRIVGRDTDTLSREGVIRAAVESVAENFSDGVLAPLLYFLIGGAPLALCYKAINTMDSMVGYKNDRYLHFGRASAKLDDAANLLPSRLSALLLIAAAAILHEDFSSAWRIWRRDRRKHESPNSAQTEAAMAGALGLQLGGPTSYFGQMHDKPFLGDNLREPEPRDISRAIRMMNTAGVLGLILLGGIRMLPELFL